MTGHGGNIEQLAAKIGCAPQALLDFSASINPLGPPPSFRAAVNRALHRITHYPDPDATALGKTLAEKHGIALEQIVVGNGTSELLFAVTRALNSQNSERALIPVPAYIDYRHACESAGLAVETVSLDPANNFRLDVSALAKHIQPGDLVIIGQPNNPTGCLVPREDIIQLANTHTSAFFLVDEAFAGFVPHYTSLAGERDNIAVLHSLTKIYAIPGLRLGYLSGPVALCKTVREKLPPWNVNTLAQEVGLAAIFEYDYLEKSRKTVIENRNLLENGLQNISGLSLVPSCANYLFFRIEDTVMEGQELTRQLLQQYKIIVRNCSNYEGLENGSNYIRIAVRATEENVRLLDALNDLLLPQQSKHKRQKEHRAASIMLQGTGSDVGKSVLAAGLCRILLQDGLRVAPFKAQNMSLNSYVTRDGGEMGRAQVVQAQACLLDPDVRMNPVLLKPSSDVGCQVIVHGKPVGNMKVFQYVDSKRSLWQEVRQAYDDLAADYDAIVLEGAGSAGEVNLKAHDIVNMRMASHAESPVLLVGDIDRGGVYASFIGHYEVMAEWERDLLAGFIVNRFRGDARLLDDAHDYIKNYTGLPVLGVVHHLDNLGLPQEDSVSFKAGLYHKPVGGSRVLDIALLDLPHISNFTDIEPLLDEEDVGLRMVQRPEDFESPDVVIVPGSKNVVSDLAFLRQQKLDERVVNFARAGGEVVGICGGYQMLGKTIKDPLGLEGSGGCSVQGLALLQIDTELAVDKTLTRQEGVHLPSGRAVTGYEIHHGISVSKDIPILQFTDGHQCGTVSKTGLIWGSYLHSIFDSDPFRHWWLDQIRLRKGMGPFSGKRAVYNLEPAFDRLADNLRSSLDMEEIYRLMGL